MKYVIRGTLGAVGLAIGVLVVIALRESTLSTHQPVPSTSQIEVIVTARTKGGEAGQTLNEMVEAQLSACRFEVKSDVVGDVEARGDGRFRAVLRPTLDETDRRQFRGCLEDWVIDHFRMDVVRMDDV